MEFGWLDRGEDREPDGIAYVGVYNIFVLQDTFLYGMEPIDGV